MKRRLDLDMREIVKKLNYSEKKYNNCDDKILSNITQVTIKLRKKGVVAQLYASYDQYGKEQYITFELLSFLDAIILLSKAYQQAVKTGQLKFLY